MHEPPQRGAGLRTLALAAAFALALLLAPAAAPSPAEAQEDDEVTAARVAGSDRTETAAQIATLTFETATAAVLVTGADFPDALAGSYPAGRFDAPLLLVRRDSVPSATLDALAELEVDSVTLLGGRGVIGEEVEAQLADEGYTIDRIAGADRYETAATIAQQFDHTGEAIDGERTAIIASGEVFADALAAGPLAARARLPLLLTPSEHTHAAVDETLEMLDIERILIVGGEAAVSGPVEGFYRNAGYAVERIAGADRTATAAAVADFAVERLGFSRSLVLLARGDDFPDALTASIHGARLGAPILLTVAPDTLGGPTDGWLADACPDVEGVRALGGTAAVSASTLDAGVQAAARCHVEEPREVSRYTTPLPHNPDRTHNIHLAADTIDGDVIPPGASYSLDDAIGDRSSARGFRVVQNGCIGADGQMVDCVGGGVSQLATTFMNAVWFSGVHLADFRPHTIWFERYPMCREATLQRHQLDVVVVNDSPYDLVVDAFYADDFVGIRLLSQPWAAVESWTSDPYAIDHGSGAFTVDCGRTITYPDGSTEEESYTWRYHSGYSGG